LLNKNEWRGGVKYDKVLNMKKFTLKQVFILVLAIVAGIAFIETSAPIWTFAFGREFLLKLLAYGAISEFIVIALSTFTKDSFK